MKLCAIVEAVKMAEGPCTIVPNQEGIIGLAPDGRTPRMCRPHWEALHLVALGNDVTFEWRKGDHSLG